MDFESSIERNIEGNLEFQEALNIAKLNSLEGKIFLVGGFVYRTLAKELYDINDKQIFDIDFIIENPINPDEITIPSGWTLINTHHKDPRFIQDQRQVDVFPLNHALRLPNYDKVDEMSVDEKLNNYFSMVPLNIQSIAYDLDEKRILGEIGKKSLLDRQIKVNGIEECISFCKSRKMSIHKFIRDKAEGLQFEAVFPNFNEESKVETKMFYDKVLDRYWKDRTESYENFIENYLSKEFNSFVENLPGKRIMDLGSGPGRDSLFFKQRGLHPVCIDISPSMVKICEENGLEAYEKDIENLNLEDESFDGIWAYASLLHLPKNRIYNSIARVRELLRPNGLFFIGMVEGDKEVLYKNDKNNHQRFFSLYQIDELKQILGDYFEIISFKKFNVRTSQSPYINFLCRKI